MIRRVFSSGILNSDDCIILTLKIKDANNINNKILNLIPGEFLEALASDALPVDSHVLPETVASLSIGGTALIVCCSIIIDVMLL